MTFDEFRDRVLAMIGEFPEGAGSFPPLLYTCNEAKGWHGTLMQTAIDAGGWSRLKEATETELRDQEAEMAGFASLADMKETTRAATKLLDKTGLVGHPNIQARKAIRVEFSDGSRQEHWYADAGPPVGDWKQVQLAQIFVPSTNPAGVSSLVHDALQLLKNQPTDET
jgi:hypothetical protein